MPPPVIVRWREMKLNLFTILNAIACQASIRHWTPAAIYCILPTPSCSWSMRQPIQFCSVHRTLFSVPQSLHQPRRR